MSSWSSTAWTTPATSSCTRPTTNPRPNVKPWVSSFDSVSKLHLGADDPSKPLLAVIIDRLSSGAAPKAATIGIEGTSVTANAKLAKDKESIDAAISDIKKTEDRSKDLIQQAKEAPTLGQTGGSAPSFGKDAIAGKETSKDSLKDSDKLLKAQAADPKKEVPKMMGAKKETDLPVQTSQQPDKKKQEISDDSLPGKKFQNIPDDAMKKKQVVEKDDGSS